MFELEQRQKLNSLRSIWDRTKRDAGAITKVKILSCTNCQKPFVFVVDNKSKTPNFCGYCGEVFHQSVEITSNFITFLLKSFYDMECPICIERYAFFPYLNIGTKKNPYYSLVENILPRYCLLCGDKFRPPFYDKKENRFKGFSIASNFHKPKIPEK